MTGTKTETGGKTGRDKAQEAKDAIVEGSAKVAEKVSMGAQAVALKTGEVGVDAQARLEAATADQLKREMGDCDKPMEERIAAAEKAQEAGIASGMHKAQADALNEDYHKQKEKLLD